MASTKIPGIYMIKNNVNGLIYIGESNNIRVRWNKYRWAATTDKKYGETTRSVTKAMRKYGLENFSFIILETGPKYEDKWYRFAKEAEYIAKYNSDDPRIGYNGCPGYERMNQRDNDFGRKQSTKEKLLRAKSIFEYDIETDSIMIYLGGAKSWADAHGTSKDIASHTINRGSVACGRYYLIPVNKKDRDLVIDKLHKKKIENAGRNATRAKDAYNAYINAVNRTIELAKRFDL